MKKSAAASVALSLLLLLSSCDADGTVTTEELTEKPVITSPITIPDLITGPEITDGPATSAQTEPDTETETEPVIETPDFLSDLSAYEKYMEPEDRDGYLILVNPSNPIDETYKPSDLEGLVDTRPDRRTRYLREYAAKALEAFLIEARANGCKDVTVTSAYRSYTDQKAIFDSDVAALMKKGYTEEEAIAIERKDTAYPGESEHQTGLAVDMHNMSSAQQAFAQTYEAKWLAENCWKFGYILRYMPDKEDITTYVYEPWHFRYVGRYHAKRIYDMGMCLEEYIEYLRTE